MSDYLYLIRNTEGTAFKIGVSINPAKRSKALQLGLDLERSMQFRVPNGSAYKVEKILHYLYRSSRFQMPPGDGYTEWFNIDALDSVVAFIASNSINLGIGNPEMLRQPKPHFVPDGLRHEEKLLSRLKKEEARKEQEEKLQDRIQNGIDHNERVSILVLQKLAKISNSEIMVGIIQPDNSPAEPENFLVLGTRSLSAVDSASGLADSLTHPDLCFFSSLDHKTAPTTIRYVPIFTSSFSLDEGQDSAAYIRINPVFIEGTRYFPHSEEIRAVLEEWVCGPDSALHPQFTKLHRLLVAESRAFWR